MLFLLDKGGGSKIPECIPGLNDDRNYYPNFGFLEVDRGARASWAWPWSSLIKGRDIGSGVLQDQIC
ncbi:hypothetical protein RHMOL_Rhmol04G0012900 [Rhododendron molle]|uniref:Uncharacterized protein n=1 Tax=Rhododendron molle TaxID=49168 RepID=A0ACC0NX42_RHOML|nr:hypothetical protein RHMOL_Rhmol04G0012900 [Rhododendron molle]